MSPQYAIQPVQPTGTSIDTQPINRPVLQKGVLMHPLAAPLSQDEIGEVLAFIRRQTRSATAAVARIVEADHRAGVESIYSEMGFETLGPDLYRAAGTDPASPPILLHHSAAERDLTVIRPLAWRDSTGGGDELRDVLDEICHIPCGGYALVRVKDRDLLVYVDHLATQQLDRSEVEASVAAARFAGALRGIDAEPGEEPVFETVAEVVARIDGFLLERPTGWARRAHGEGLSAAWFRDGRAPIAGYIDNERGLLVVARSLRSFLGNPGLDVVERLLRMNAGLLDGALTTLRNGSQGAIVILQRLCLRDLDIVELDRSISYLERVKIPWAREGRSAIELLGVLERSRRPLHSLRVTQASASPAPVQQWPQELSLGTTDSGEELHLAVSDLLTHMFVCGGSGSGKTVACKNLLEELALAGVPSLVIDLKGDLSSLACLPGSTSSTEIARYLHTLYGEAAPTNAVEIAEHSGKAAELYASTGLDDEALQDYRERVQFRVLTPRSKAGIPLALSPLGKIELGSIGESSGIIGNQSLHELVDSNIRSLVEHLDLSEGDTENLVAVLIQVLESAHRQGLPLQGIEGVETLVKLLYDVSEHTESINFLPTEWAIDPKMAERYARAMNARLGGTFRYWFDGESLSIDDLISIDDGRVPINIINLSMLPGTPDQSYAIAQINSHIIEWMRRQPGAQRPRLAYFIDEIAQDGAKGAIYPPYPRNPITKPGLTVLLKQGRAFGVSCILATQSAKDIDYKGLGQIDTWLLGRLKSEKDVERVALGIEAAQAEATRSFDVEAQDMLSKVAGLPPGSFVIKTKSKGVFTYRQRWIRSLHDRMTAHMVENWVRAEELSIHQQVVAAQELWDRGAPDCAIAKLEEVLAAAPYYTRAAETRLLLCEWLFRTEQWSRVADYTSALHGHAGSGFEKVFYYEGIAHLKLDHQAEARLALERFVASAAGSAGTLGERCREYLSDLFVAQDDYESLEEAASQRGSGSSRLIEFCRTMKRALARWPTLQGQLDGATVLETGDDSARIRFARKGERNLQSYAAEIERRLGDLDLSAPEISPLSPEEAESLERITARIAVDELERQSREDQLGEVLAEAERLIELADFAGASDEIDAAKKLVRSGGLSAEPLERVISLYRGATSAGRRTLSDWLVNLDPYAFELEVAALLRSLGYDAQATKATGDGGVDVFAAYRNRRYVIQCKRYRHPVAPGDVRELATTMRNFDADEAIFVTTSRFTDGCREEAARHDIQLIDLEDLIQLYSARATDDRGARGLQASDEDRDSQGSRHREDSRWAEAVIAVLDNADGPLAISEIAEAAEINVAACRRILTRLIEDGTVTRSGKKRGTRYRIAAD